ncbi:MAG: hypothetical protein ACOY5Y_06905 [Pseudomonadota bacterium]
MAYRVYNSALGRTVGLCARLGWAVHLCCANGHSARWNPARLAEDFHPDVILDDIAARLTCKVCGATEGSLDIFQDVAFTQARDIARFEESGKSPGTGRA